MANKKTWDNIFMKIFMNWLIKPWLVSKTIFNSKLWRTFTVLYTLSFIATIIAIPIIYVYAYYEENLYRYYDSNESIKIEIQDIKGLDIHIQKHSDIENFWKNTCLTISNNNYKNQYEVVDLGYKWTYYSWKQDCFKSIYENSNYSEWNDIHPNEIKNDYFISELRKYIQYLEDIDIAKRYEEWKYIKSIGEKLVNSNKEYESELSISFKINRSYHEDNIFIFYILPLLVLLFLKYWISIIFIIIRYIFRFIKNG